MVETDHAATAATLHRAADLIESKGWQQGTGWNLDRTDTCGPYCVEGALKAVTALCEDYPAKRVLEDYLLERSPECLVNGRIILFAWNDRSNRTAAEVVEVLRACAAIEQSKADELTPEPPVLHHHADGTWTVTYNPSHWSPEFVAALVERSAPTAAVQVAAMRAVADEAAALAVRR